VQDTFNKIFPFFLKKRSIGFVFASCSYFGEYQQQETPFMLSSLEKTDIRLPGQATHAAMPNIPQQRVHCLAVSFFFFFLRLSTLVVL
jgi:hypothetical protein